MQSKKSYITAMLCAIGLSVLIIDAKTAVLGASNGIALCIETVIPSLFPFVFLTTMLLPTINHIKLLQPLGRICGIPKGLEQILLIGFLGGYPIGAQTVTLAWKQRRIATTDAHRMLGFCSNAGPSFLFGMGAVLFNNIIYIWIIWFIHVFSALLVGIILPGKRNLSGTLQSPEPVNAVTALKTSIYALSRICGWVVLFKILLTFLNHWILCYCSNTIHALITGLFELSNGFIESKLIANVGLRIIIVAMIVGFGGICVLFQTLSVTDKLGIGYYFPGKVLQSIISFLSAYVAQMLILPVHQRIILPMGCIIGACLSGTIVLLYLYRKKVVAITTKIRYNTGRKSKKEKFHVISQKAPPCM